MANLADVAITVPCDDTQHIQEVQIVLIHLLCDLVEQQVVAHDAAAAQAATLSRRRPPSLAANRLRPRAYGKAGSR